MSCSVATWNINSVRLRANIIGEYCASHQPDILCLQETKTEDQHFPVETLREFGYEHLLYTGQKSYNGVAILSKLPLEPLPFMDMTGDGAKRHVGAMVDGRFALHNFYIPAGGDEPDPDVNPKFKNKLDFLEALSAWTPQHKDVPAVMVGDFNIAPYEHDVWSHKQLLKVVSHTPIEVEKLNALKAIGGWIDVAREFIPEGEKCYSWWSYRNRDWRKSNRGRRLDHIWVTEPLRASLENYHVFEEARDWEKPSDHVPIMMTLKQL